MYCFINNILHIIWFQNHTIFNVKTSKKKENAVIFYTMSFSAFIDLGLMFEDFPIYWEHNSLESDF